MRSIILDAEPLNPGDLSWQPLTSLADFTIYAHSTLTEGTERASGAQALFTNKYPLSATSIDSLPDLKYIGVLATGVNVVDLAKAQARGITVTNIPDYSSDSVAQHVFALLLSVSNHVMQHNDSVKAGDWTNCRDFSYWLSDISSLSGQTLGLIGYGRIAKRVARIAKSFDMKVCVYTPRPVEGSDVHFVDLDRLFRESDVISLHCPLNEDTTEIINENRLNQMKKNSVLINTGRGGLVNECDLTRALSENSIKAACLDVMVEEPPRNNSLLISLNNCIITPHIAWTSKQARQRLLCIAADNFASYLKGEKQNVVCPC